MKALRVGLVADPSSPTDIARSFDDVEPPRGRARGTWDVDVVSEPFTTGAEDAGTAVDRLSARADEREWDIVVGLTELPLRGVDGRYLVVDVDRARRTALVSLPALGGFRVRSRAHRAISSSVRAMVEDPDVDRHRRVSLPRSTGHWRLLLGMVLANRPWLLVPGLKSALVAALATGAVATINSTVWLLAGSLSPWRLVVATVVSVALVVAWLIIDGELWDRPTEESDEARTRSRLYNTSTLVTLTTGVLICYVVLYLVNLLWALFVLDPSVMGGYLGTSLDHGDLFVLAWFVASAATVGGGLGTGLESDDAIRRAAYTKREEERRRRLARERR